MITWINKFPFFVMLKQGRGITCAFKHTHTTGGFAYFICITPVT